MKLCRVITWRNPDQVHPQMFKPKDIADRSGVPNGVLIELMDVFDFIRFADGFGG